MNNEEPVPDLANEDHHSPQWVADRLDVSVDTVIRQFRNEPGVIWLGSDERLHKRGKKIMRIPHSVYLRWHEKHRTIKPPS